MSSAPNVIAMPQSTKVILCAKCGREMTVGPKTVMAFCRDCSATMGVKK